MKVIRWVLGRIILLLNFLIPPKTVVRDVDAQKVINNATAKMSLYQFHACPFCVKVRRQLKGQALPIELRDAKAEGEFKAELIREGGRHKVPCLRIEKADESVGWLYESNKIMDYLNDRFNLA